VCYTNFVILITITIIIINIPAGLKGNCYGGTAGVASREERKARIGLGLGLVRFNVPLDT